jgi:hypothetical protein
MLYHRNRHVVARPTGTNTGRQDTLLDAIHAYVHKVYTIRCDTIRYCIYGCIMISPCRHLVMLNNKSSTQTKNPKAARFNSTPQSTMQAHIPLVPERFKCSQRMTHEENSSSGPDRVRTERVVVCT